MKVTVVKLDVEATLKLFALFLIDLGNTGQASLFVNV